MRFHAACVSTSADGDYYQLWLGRARSDDEEVDPYEVRGPYLIVQRNFGLSKEELRAVLMHIAVYCGIPVGVDCFRASKNAFADPK